MPRAALKQARRNERVRKLGSLWAALARLAGGTTETDGRITVAPADADTGVHRITCHGLKAIHPKFADKPLLHLDATLRPEIAAQVLPGLAVAEVETAAPHMSVTLVTGRFGKTAIVPDQRSSAEERRRRENNLRDCVDYLRWQAHRLGRVLVVTYKDIAPAFAGISGVEVVHFNTIAGLDTYGDVDGLIVIGRPLPRDTDLAPCCAAFDGHVPAGGYAPTPVGIRMRDGSSRTMGAFRHEDPVAERFRAAICDDEVIQAIGRGRGVNRGAANPLKVQILADVALPLVHDRLVAWETVRPDLVQRMLLAGLAVDSPADAAALHPELFDNPNTAKMAFRHAGFKGQVPMGNTYRGRP